MNTSSPLIDRSSPHHRQQPARPVPTAQRITPPSGMTADNRGDLRAVERARAQIRDIVTGHDPRLLVVVGPCSVDDPTSALAFAECLSALQKETEHEVLICMRTYFEKPRTTVGWKGWFS